jgi:hypothetical protein
MLLPATAAGGGGPLLVVTFRAIASASSTVVTLRTFAEPNNGTYITDDAALKVRLAELERLVKGEDSGTKEAAKD